MTFLVLMFVVAAFAYIPQYLRGPRGDWRMALRHGMGGAFLYTGVDHFVSLHERYLPMIPPYLEPWGTGLVMASGALEIAGAVGLLVPARGWTRLGLPDLRPVAGVGLAMLLSVMVVANAHVAEAGARVGGLPFGALYYALRPFAQPLIVLWALVASEAVMPPARTRRAA